MKKYNIVLIEFPFVEDVAQSKTRPCIILTKPYGTYKTVLCAPVTSKIDTGKFSIVLDPNIELDSLLNSLSVIRLDRISVLIVPQNTVKLGTLSTYSAIKLKNKLKLLFNI